MLWCAAVDDLPKAAAATFRQAVGQRSTGEREKLTCIMVGNPHLMAFCGPAVRTLHKPGPRRGNVDICGEQLKLFANTDRRDQSIRFGTTPFPATGVNVLSYSRIFPE